MVPRAAQTNPYTGLDAGGVSLTSCCSKQPQQGLLMRVCSLAQVTRVPRPAGILGMPEREMLAMVPRAAPRLPCADSADWRWSSHILLLIPWTVATCVVQKDIFAEHTASIPKDCTTACLPEALAPQTHHGRLHETAVTAQAADRTVMLPVAMCRSLCTPLRTLCTLQASDPRCSRARSMCVQLLVRPPSPPDIFGW